MEIQTSLIGNFIIIGIRMSEKTYRGDFMKMYGLLKDQCNFSFCKFSDGELWILQGRKFTLSPKLEHHSYQDIYDYKDFDPDRDVIQREALFAAFRYNHPRYYIGICSPSDQDKSVFNWLRKESGRSEDHLTWANIFVNSNYRLYRETFIPEYKNRKLVLVCSTHADINKAVFATSIVKDFRVGPNCIVNDYNLIEVVKRWMVDKQINNHVFLFAASSLGNYMAHQLHEVNPNNTYIDVGSTLNPDFGLNLDRGYLSAAFGVLWRGSGDTSQDLLREEVWDERGVELN